MYIPLFPTSLPHPLHSALPAPPHRVEIIPREVTLEPLWIPSHPCRKALVASCAGLRPFRGWGGLPEMLSEEQRQPLKNGGSLGATGVLKRH